MRPAHPHELHCCWAWRTMSKTLCAFGLHTIHIIYSMSNAVIHVAPRRLTRHPASISDVAAVAHAAAELGDNQQWSPRFQLQHSSCDEDHDDRVRYFLVAQFDLMRWQPSSSVSPTTSTSLPRSPSLSSATTTTTTLYPLLIRFCHSLGSPRHYPPAD